MNWLADHKNKRYVGGRLGLAIASTLCTFSRYHGDNASSDAISERLRDICPGLYRVEDAKLAKANEIILSAKANPNKAEKEKGFKEAVAVSLISF